MALADLISIGISLVGLAIAIAGFLLFRNGKRSTEPSCPACRYALAGLPGVERAGDAYEPVTCPECGHAARKRIRLFRRKRRPAWLPLAFLGIAILVEPLVLGNARRVYDRLSDATIAHLHANWNDRHARWIVEDRIRSRIRSVGVPFGDAHMLTLARGAIARIERAAANGKVERIDATDVLILSWLDARRPSIVAPAFASRIAAAMPPLFGHPDAEVRRHASWLSRDRNDPALSVAAVLDACHDTDPLARAAAATALYDHVRHGQDVAEQFVGMLDDPDPGVRAAAAMRLRRHAERFQPPASLGPPLHALEPEHPEAARARVIGLLATLRGDELVEACRTSLREGADDERWEALRLVSHRPDLIAALLPEWGKERRGPIEYWLQAQQGRPIDEVLEELGFE